MLDRIQANPRAARLLADVFDFDLERTDHVEPARPSWDGEFLPIAGDASGGTFYLCGGPVLYASSEGQAGVLAADPTAAIELIIGVPTWHDVVSAAPDLDAMRAAFEATHPELGPDIDQHQAEVRAELGLGPVPVDELLVRLRASVTELSPEYRLLNEEGDEYEQL
ncbi:MULTISPECIES: hypothetical protein [Saccharothrix]|uniref:hypothetical protein n=1 Tax=Saccharothrix TaxID=2071 RepID=UPI00093AFE9D|nr:hypothetical protein [Saccharothrix sp. CB00851]OKI24968.1 hypothetical protein A6A25_33810 [Saccharothrix sp. CB00851]